MTNEHTLVPENSLDQELLNEQFDEEELETLADYHRMASLHYAQAAKHHTLAADADDHGHDESRDTHAFLAYRHKLVANQYAEIAVIESDDLGEDVDISIEAAHTA